MQYVQKRILIDTARAQIKEILMKVEAETGGTVERLDLEFIREETIGYRVVINRRVTLDVTLPEDKHWA